MAFVWHQIRPYYADDSSHVIVHGVVDPRRVILDGGRLLRARNIGHIVEANCRGSGMPKPGWGCCA